MSREPVFVSSRDNPLLTKLRKLIRDPGSYRKLGQVWLEGEHLCAACTAQGPVPTQAVLSEAGWGDANLRALASRAPRITVLSEALFAGISALESQARIGFVIERPVEAAVQGGLASVVLDRLQDAGNVGSVLRSAAALGVAQVVALEGTAALWSPKVLRAGMGAHFALRLVEGAKVGDLDALAVPLVATSSHAERSIAEGALPEPCAWVFGHEGQGVDAALLARCAQTRRIPQPGGEESLNVAAAAAICLYESLRQRGA
ncbi:MAG: RNA methyltransferase [Methylibium sp.]|uniref:TrmH family RNA methyltransferase n=1 Tax=Methylibium sp. TaxID=2067992 RepID=UPI001830EE3F|nr:RNA methyltransferase [Methylibium sp.]MBA3598058.1 RNA methyltransferase [Methylibium sp.]